MKQIDKIILYHIRIKLVAIKRELEKGENDFGSKISPEYIIEKANEIIRVVKK